jgi:hypothetical protein
MNCHETRDRLSTDAPRPAGPVAEHLRDCAACTRFARRLEAARAILRDHHCQVEPDAHFASRIAARLGDAPNGKLGWAAVRVLPATVALLLVLAWLSWETTPNPSSLFASSPTEDLLTWVLERAGEDS